MKQQFDILPLKIMAQTTFVQCFMFFVLWCYFFSTDFLPLAIVRLTFPLTVLVLVFVRWPRTGNPFWWRVPRYDPISLSRLIFISFAWRNSPSILYFFSTVSRSLLTCSVVNFPARIFGSILACSKISLLKESPIP